MNDNSQYIDTVYLLPVNALKREANRLLCAIAVCRDCVAVVSESEKRSVWG
jgi:hypothetical protein